MIFPGAPKRAVRERPDRVDTSPTNHNFGLEIQPATTQLCSGFDPRKHTDQL